jgi:hypothetical protein
MEDLVKAATRILLDTQPYYQRFLADNYTSKLRALNDIELEEGKFILTGGLLDTIYNNEESIEKIQSIVKEENGTTLPDTRAWFYWDERLYPLRIKRHGPSLVPAEMLAPLEKLPEILEKTNSELRKSNVAIEGTLSNDGQTSFMVWILDDERKSVSFTIGWQRSFQIAKLAERFGGLPYAVGLWNGRHAQKFYGNQVFDELKTMKKKLDPKNLMNPVKVFGGRVTAGRESTAFGFFLGFFVVLLAGWVVPRLLGWAWLTLLLNSTIIPGVSITLLFAGSLVGGVIGVAVVRLMTLNQALSIGIPLLRLLSKILRK